MEKKMKYDFELKLKFLNFFICMGLYPPPAYPQKWILGGDMTPTNTAIY
jgi:hypothetical protein